jgi:hypothetical protein
MERLEQLQKVGIYKLQIFPLLLRTFSEELDVVEAEILQGIQSTDVEEVKDAMYAAYLWIARSHQGRCKHSKQDLMEFMIDTIISAKQPLLKDVMDYIIDLLQNIPERFSGTQIDRLNNALRFLLEDTQLPKRSLTMTADEDYSRIPLPERPDYRSLAACLACKVYSWYEKVSPQSVKPAILLKWQEVCKDDVLPEVRQAWSE